MKRGLVTCPKVHDWKGHSWALSKGCPALLGGLGVGRGLTPGSACGSGSRTQGGAYLYLAGVTQRAAGEGGGCSSYLVLCTQTLLFETMTFILFSNLHLGWAQRE